MVKVLSIVVKMADGRFPSLSKTEKKTIYCQTRREAEKERTRLSQEKEQEIHIAASNQTLSQFLTDWLENTAALRVRPRTRIRYRELITLHILPTLGNIKLQKVTPQHLQKLEEGLAPGTVKNIHRLLHRTLNDALKWRLVMFNMCDAVDAPRVPSRELRTLTIEQAQTFLATIADDPLEALYVLALLTGMRQGELLALKWADIDFEHKRLRVTKTIARVLLIRAFKSRKRKQQRVAEISP